MIGTEREGFYEGPSGSRFGRLLDFLNRLDSVGLHYALAHTRPDSIMVDVSVPGWRWEVEFMADGSLAVERYRSVAGVESDPGLLDQLVAEFGSGDPAL
jgi:hypothetical protein